MLLKILAKQLLHDLKASWKKAAFLGVLLIIGLCFWIPQLVRALGSGAPSTPSGAVQAASATVNTPVKIEMTFNASPQTSLQAKNQKYNWQQRSKLMETDPLVQSVEVAAIQGNPFRIDNDQFPPPVLFAEEPKVEPKLKVEEQANPKSLERLVLKSTIVGVKRRAAFINTRLYQEGKQIRIDGESYLLSAVYPRKVILKQGDREFELKIAGQTGLVESNLLEKDSRK